MTDYYSNRTRKPDSDDSGGIGAYPAPYQAGLTITEDFSLTLPAGTNLAAGDKLALAYVPADCVVVDALIRSDDLDTGTAITLDVGLFRPDADMTEIDRDAFVDGSTVGQAGGIITAPNRHQFLSLSRRDEAMTFGAQVATAPAGNPNTQRVILGWVQYRSKGPRDA